MPIPQAELCVEILRLIGRRFGEKTVTQEQWNAVVRAANVIVAAYDEPEHPLPENSPGG